MSLQEKKTIFYCPSDGIISKSASIYKAVKRNPVGETTLVKMHAYPFPSDYSHMRPLYPDEANMYYKELLEMLDLDMKDTDLRPFKMNDEGFVKLLKKQHYIHAFFEATYPTCKVFNDQLAHGDYYCFSPGKLDGSLLSCKKVGQIA